MKPGEHERVEQLAGLAGRAQPARRYPALGDGRHAVGGDHRVQAQPERDQDVVQRLPLVAVLEIEKCQQEQRRRGRHDDRQQAGLMEQRASARRTTSPRPSWHRWRSGGRVAGVVGGEVEAGVLVDDGEGDAAVTRSPAQVGIIAFSVVTRAGQVEQPDGFSDMICATSTRTFGFAPRSRPRIVVYALRICRGRRCCSRRRWCRSA